jgi:hypothetical protein
LRQSVPPKIGSVSLYGEPLPVVTVVGSGVVVRVGVPVW